MQTSERYAEIPEIKTGIIFSDPSYGPDIWCQYRKEFAASGWGMKLKTLRDESDYIEMTLCVGRRTLLSGLSVEEADGQVSVSYPARFRTDHYEIGIDTAKVFVGTLSSFRQWGEEGSIYTGADGLFGDLQVFTCKGEEKPAGFLLTSAVDGSLTTEEELFQTLLSSFQGQEIDKSRFDEITDRNHLSVRLQASAELSHAKEEDEQNQSLEQNDPDKYR